MLIDIYGQAFELDPDVISGILDAESMTASDGVEHGFKLCETKSGTLVPGPKCTGNQCSILLKDCGNLGKDAGSFHSHPDVISFSLGDYVGAAMRAALHPQHKSLNCVALKDQGIRCKALTKLPPANLVQALQHMPDTDSTRNAIKPFFTEKVNVSNEALQALLSGTPWDELPTSQEVCAIDEGPEQMKGEIGCLEDEIKEESMGVDCSSIPGGCPWPTKPTGEYPWTQKKQYKSVKTPGGIAMVPIEAVKIIDKQTKFIDITTIEEPDPELIHMGEVMGYVNALTPIQIVRGKKDQYGKAVIHDGRHRVAAWKVAGYKQIPVVEVEVPEGTPTGGKPVEF